MYTPSGGLYLSEDNFLGWQGPSTPGTETFSTGAFRSAFGPVRTTRAPNYGSFRVRVRYSNFSNDLPDRGGVWIALSQNRSMLNLRRQFRQGPKLKWTIYG
jgi:hypothetical protein